MGTPSKPYPTALGRHIPFQIKLDEAVGEEEALETGPSRKEEGDEKHNSRRKTLKSMDTVRAVKDADT